LLLLPWCEIDEECLVSPLSKACAAHGRDGSPQAAGEAGFDGRRELLDRIEPVICSASAKQTIESK